MKILSIETSCDDSAISVVEAEGSFGDARFRTVSDVLSSQASLHSQYGGVFPMMAKREHARNLVPLLEEALAPLQGPQASDIPEDEISAILEREPELAEALLPYLSSVSRPDIDLIAVTNGPGLEPTLWVGINLAKALSLAWNIPVLPVNHMRGHLLSSLYAEGGLRPLSFPALGVLVSGGHTELVLMKSWTEQEVIGQTRDDAVGEAFDKAARMLGLPYPGGPEISKLAERGNENPSISLPRPMLSSGDFDFSFSGLKTAVLYLVRDLGDSLDQQAKADIAREFQEAAVEVIVRKAKAAAEEHGISTILVGGGVSANALLREKLSALEGYAVYFPSPSLSTDNALMIALAGYFDALSGKVPPSDIQAEGNLRL